MTNNDILYSQKDDHANRRTGTQACVIDRQLTDKKDNLNRGKEET